MTNIVPTTEQHEVIRRVQDVLRGTAPSLCIEALAGSAKTTTIKLALNEASANKIDLSSVLAVAFNKRIAEDLIKALPPAVTCKTLNSLGHSAWGKSIGRRLTLDQNKIWNIIQDSDPDKAAMVRTMITVARNTGFVPKELKHPSARNLVPQEVFINDCESAALDLANSESVEDCWESFITAMHESIRQAHEGLIDFQDQIYMSACFGGVFQKFSTVIVDEAQDLSPINHEILRKSIASNGRLIAVGDSRQAIYAFRGASTQSIAVLRDTFDCQVLRLTTCFRCSKSVIREAQRIVPEIKSPDWMEEGNVGHANNLPDIVPNLAILCRNNAPLVKLAFHLIKQHKAVQILGRDIGQGLIRQVKKFAPERYATTQEFLEVLHKWFSAQPQHKKVKLVDKINCLEVICSTITNTKDIVPTIEELFADKSNATVLSTGHKCKGLEWDNVWIIHPELIPSVYATEPEAVTQEYNLKYVMITRAKKNLTIITRTYNSVKETGWEK